MNGDMEEEEGSRQNHDPLDQRLGMFSRQPAQNPNSSLFSGGRDGGVVMLTVGVGSVSEFT